MVDSQEEKCIYLTKTEYCVCEEKNDGKKIWNCTHLILAKPQDAQNYSDLLAMLEDQYARHLANVCPPQSLLAWQPEPRHCWDILVSSRDAS